MKSVLLKTLLVFGPLAIAYHMRPVRPAVAMPMGSRFTRHQPFWTVGSLYSPNQLFNQWYGRQ